MILKVWGLLCVLLAAGTAVAQQWPAKPVRIIVATSPGGPYDETARAVGPKLTEIWGQTIIVDNRPGAANIIGATLAASALLTMLNVARSTIPACTPASLQACS